MTLNEFNEALKCASRTAPAMRRALRDILVYGLSWRQAAIANEVTESGILRAMRRIGLGRYTPRMQPDIAQLAKKHLGESQSA
jgi:hypothetical protein